MQPRSKAIATFLRRASAAMPVGCNALETYRRANRWPLPLPDFSAGGAIYGFMPWKANRSSHVCARCWPPARRSARPRPSCTSRDPRCTQSPSGTICRAAGGDSAPRHVGLCDANWRPAIIQPMRSPAWPAATGRPSTGMQGRSITTAVPPGRSDKSGAAQAAAHC